VTALAIGARTFPSKKAAREFYSAMLWRYRPGERLTPEDEADVRALLERHPEAADKIGCGIDHIAVEPNDYGSHGFVVVRGDGSHATFSYLYCISQKPNGAKVDVCKALRYAVRDQVLAARDRVIKNGQAECAFSGVPLGKNEGHVDHAGEMTFDLLAEHFVTIELGLDWVDVPLREVGGGALVITDQQLVAEWREFHAKYAKLQFIDKKLNLIKGDSGI